MLEFQCPSCKAKCSVDDQFRGRKLRCPKCQTRIRHHLDGTIELLSLGDPPPPAAPAPVMATTEAVPAAPPPPPAAPAADAAPATPQATGVMGRFSRQSESRQTAIILVLTGVALIVVVVAVGLFTKDVVLSIGALAAGFTVAFAVLFVRAKRHARKAAPPAAVKDDGKTEPLPKL